VEYDKHTRRCRLTNMVRKNCIGREKAVEDGRRGLARDERRVIRGAVVLAEHVHAPNDSDCPAKEERLADIKESTVLEVVKHLFTNYRIRVRWLPDVAERGNR